MIRAMIPLDVDLLEVQEKQAHYKSHIQNIALINGFFESYTYIDKEGIKAVFGMQPVWKGRSAVWALIGDVKNWVEFHKSVKATLDMAIKRDNLKRIELTTEVGFVESERWARMLGFKFESLMPFYGVDGQDHKMWVILCPVQ